MPRAATPSLRSRWTSADPSNATSLCAPTANTVRSTDPPVDLGGSVERTVFAVGAHKDVAFVRCHDAPSLENAKYHIGDRGNNASVRVRQAVDCPMRGAGRPLRVRE